MDQDRFDNVVKSLATGADRRSVLKRIAGGALGGLLALRGGAAVAQPGCRQEGHPCEGNQVCCPGLVCTPAAGPGQAARCTAPTPPPPPKCGYEKAPCNTKTPCCKGYYCKNGYCKKQCGYEKAFCNAKTPCCKGYYCSKDGYCKRSTNG